ncbi:response regulator [Eubacterium multiforme]|uniref:Stage 0 sporulation protein A homolog n=1 Tax=Eubacterium multiforme TaxID=83339 RepID=A0ABT9UPX6_9FIRM|nr:response regulator [Eubacterium multiforme]MDQ0148698.1 two-component system response regulator YesN [Eubacterium multiforme]
MELYRVLIVDDEREIRKNIINKIDWKKYGFVVIGEGENGREALEKAKTLKPDVIITDTKMPFMDGIELGEKINEIMPNIKIIIFSCSDEFEYAHKAIKINALDYLLKPIKTNELIEVLKKLKEKMDNEYSEKKNVEKLYKYYIESLPLLKEKFLVGTLEGRIRNKKLEEEGKKVGIRFNSKFYSVAVIYTDNFIDENSEEFLEKDNLIDISIKQISDDIMEKYCECVSFIYSGTVVLIGNFDERENVLDFIEGLNEVCRVSKRIVRKNVSAGVGQVTDSYLKIRFSYKMARNALHYRMILGSGKAIYIEDVEPDNSVQLQFDENDERELLNAIKIKSKDEIEKIICKLFFRVENLLLPFNKYKIYLIEITTALLKLVRTYNLDIGDIFHENFNCYSHLDNFDSIENVKKWFMERAIKINNLIRRERLNSSKFIIEKAKEYIYENYNDSDISVEKICKYLYVSPTYFSTIFKRETGTSFINYLTTIRLDAALNLLNTTDYKSYIIAKKVGYPEANYFSYVFKKKFGVSPSKYRVN